MNNKLSLPSRPREASVFKLVAISMLLALCTMIMAPSAWSQQGTATSSDQPTEGGTPSSAGMQAAAAVSTILYFPFKAAFAICGGIVGGLAYAFSGGNEQAAKSIWDTSLRGTYVITPDHLQGNRPVRFLGVADSSDEPAQASAPEPIR